MSKKTNEIAGCASHTKITESEGGYVPFLERAGSDDQILFVIKILTTRWVRQNPYPQAVCTKISPFPPAFIASLFLPLFLCLTIPAFSQEEDTLDPRKSWEITEAKWEEVADYEGRFRVLTPAQFQSKKDTIDTPLGELVYHTLFVAPTSDKAENEVYMISYVDYPEGVLHRDSADLINAFLDETQSAAVESVRGEMMFSQEGYHQTFPYRYWRIDFLNGRGSIRTKAIVANNRFYTIQTVTQRDYGINHSTDRFIDSFYVFAANKEENTEE